MSLVSLINSTEITSAEFLIGQSCPDTLVSEKKGDCLALALAALTILQQVCPDRTVFVIEDYITVSHARAGVILPDGDIETLEMHARQGAFVDSIVPSHDVVEKLTAGPTLIGGFHHDPTRTFAKKRINRNSDTKMIIGKAANPVKSLGSIYSHTNGKNHWERTINGANALLSSGYLNR